jgi:ectoine hydroxylase-related dioxygenase (phytanoyl-CoA dioxygenase family)
MSLPPEKAYGILDRDTFSDPIDSAADQIRRLGYAIVSAGFSPSEIAEISERFDATRVRYIAQHGEARLRAADEYNGIRLPMALDPAPFRKLALNANILSLLGQLIHGQFILNQQNGVINPAGKDYNQGQWHRDLPYQHFLSSTPLAINALYCVDDFTLENGSTWVLPATHKTAAFPDPAYLRHHALQVSVKAGEFIVLDCMLYHTGGQNRSGADRRAVNHVYTIPYFSQQIQMPGNVSEDGLDDTARRILGFNNTLPASVADYLDRRTKA